MDRIFFSTLSEPVLSTWDTATPHPAFQKVEITFGIDPTSWAGWERERGRGGGGQTFQRWRKTETCITPLEKIFLDKRELGPYTECYDGSTISGREKYQSENVLRIGRSSRLSEISPEIGWNLYFQGSKYASPPRSDTPRRNFVLKKNVLPNVLSNSEKWRRIKSMDFK